MENGLGQPNVSPGLHNGAAERHFECTLPIFARRWNHLLFPHTQGDTRFGGKRE
jgi:hypothetical protein